MSKEITGDAAGLLPPERRQPPLSQGGGSSKFTLPHVPELTRQQTIYIGIVAFIAWTLAVYDQITFGNVLPFIQKDFHWSVAQVSYVATLVSLASLICALIVGPLIDLAGRKFSLFITTAGAAVGSLLSGFATGAVTLVLFRSLSGFGMSEQAVNAAYLNEVFKPKRKGIIYGLVQAGWPAGVMLSAGIAIALIPSVGWRGVFIIASAPLLIIFVLRFWLKESPYFTKLKHIRSLRNSGKDEEAAYASQTWGIELEQARKNTYAPLFSRAQRRQTI